jgi:hypothetical protein
VCSAVSSAKTSSLVCIFFSRNSIRFCFSSAWRRGSLGPSGIARMKKPHKRRRFQCIVLAIPGVKMEILI